MQRSAAVGKRLEIIDLARGLALVAMAVYHFTWDLEFFGYAPAGMTAQGGWRLFARGIASSFLFLVGVSLFLAHAKGVKWRPFGRRWAMIAGAAAAITIATFFAVPDAFIFFGILHQIAVASLLGLLFLRFPAWATIAVAVAVIALPLLYRSPLFDLPPLWWIGLSATPPRSNDYVPLLPFFGAVLLGIATARLAEGVGIFERMRGLSLPRWTAPLQFAGRHSLAVYLIHQPVLIALLWIFAQVAPPAETPREENFTRSCAVQCMETRNEEAFCTHYCGCVLDRLQTEGSFDEVYEGRSTPQTSQRLQEIVAACSFDAEVSGMEEE